MKEALYYKQLKNNNVQCQLCPRHCLILENEIGKCHVRKNIKGKLYSLVYGKPVSVAIDPIEKKPLYHFLPGSKSFSIGTIGCNLHCLHCQNWETSQAFPGEFSEHELMPSKIIEEAEKNDCKSISYTYNEPTIFYEYSYDAAKIANNKKIKNVIVSNGFINEKPLREWCKYLDGVNIDLKFFDDKLYRKTTTAWLEPVLETLKILKEEKVWFEITNLIIPGLNDDLKLIEKMCEWIKENLGVDNPLHFSAFYPCYKMLEKPAASPEILFKARDAALKIGLKYVYTGNIMSEEGNNTYCPECKEVLIERYGFGIIQNNIKNRKCKKCGEKIAGVWV